MDNMLSGEAECYWAMDLFGEVGLCLKRCFETFSIFIKDDGVFIELECFAKRIVQPFNRLA